MLPGWMCGGSPDGARQTTRIPPDDMSGLRQRDDQVRKKELVRGGLRVRAGPRGSVAPNRSGADRSAVRRPVVRGCQRSLRTWPIIRRSRSRSQAFYVSFPGTFSPPSHSIAQRRHPRAIPLDATALGVRFAAPACRRQRRTLRSAKPAPRAARQRTTREDGGAPPEQPPSRCALGASSLVVTGAARPRSPASSRRPAGTPAAAGSPGAPSTSTAGRPSAPRAPPGRAAGRRCRRASRS